MWGESASCKDEALGFAKCLSRTGSASDVEPVSTSILEIRTIALPIRSVYRSTQPTGPPLSFRFNRECSAAFPTRWRRSRLAPPSQWGEFRTYGCPCFIIRIIADNMNRVNSAGSGLGEEGRVLGLNCAQSSPSVGVSLDFI